MFKRRILILDCTRKEEPSEGRLLKEFFKICRLYKPAKAFPLVYKINSKKGISAKTQYKQAIRHHPYFGSRWDKKKNRNR